ncbi:MAG: translocation/assembly module TamB domain-containing protein [Bacteroidales bacterium]
MFAIPTVFWLIIQSSQVQTRLVAKVTSILHSNTGIGISVGAVDFRPFNTVLLKDVFIADLNNDTLIHAKKISLSLLHVKPSEGSFRLNRVAIDRATINLISDTAGVMNISALLNKLSQDSTQQEDSTGSFTLTSNKVSISNTGFRLKHINAPAVEFGVNFDDLYLSDLNIDARNFRIAGDTIAITINGLNCTDQSGFKLDNLRADLSLCSKYMNFGKLRIQAHGSNIKLDHLNMAYNGWKQFSNFVNNVKLDAEFTNTYVKTSTLAYIIPAAKKVNLAATLDGKIKGTVSDFSGKNVRVTMGAQTLLSTNFSVTGLPNIDQALMIIDIKELSTTRNDIMSVKDTGNVKPLLNVPKELEVLGKVTYKGNFTGYINNFVAYGSINSAVGKVGIDLSFIPENNSINKVVNFSGNMGALNFDVGKLVQSDLLGKITFQAKVKGSTDEKANVKAFTDATIKSFMANKYDYSGIEISGNLTNKTYLGSIHLNDPNCKLNFLGKIDFSDSIPVFDFSAFVPRIDLVKLNLNSTDSISQLSFLLTTKFSGSNLDNSKGEIKVVNSSYKNQRGEFKLSDITINADNTTESKLISLKSEFAEGEIRSKYNYSNVFNYLRGIFYKYVPAFIDQKTATLANTGVEKPEYNDYLIKFRLKKTQKITSIVAPDFSIAENTSVFGILNPDLQTLTFKIKVPELQMGSMYVKDLSIDGQTKDSILIANIAAPTIKLGTTQVNNLKISSAIKDNILNSSLGWQNLQKPANYGLIEAAVNFNESGKNGHIAELNFKPSSFVVNDSTWQLSASSIIFDTARIKIDNFLVHSQNQRLDVNGIISANAYDSLAVKLANLNLSYLNIYLQGMGYNLSGKINGSAKINSLYANPTLFANINISNFTVNSNPVGNVVFTSAWQNSDKKMVLNLSNEYRDTVTLAARGSYFTENGNLDFSVDINRIKLLHLAPLLAGGVSDLNGNINGKLRLTGTTQKPLLNGYINLTNSRLKVDFLNTMYTLNDKLEIENSDIYIRNLKIYDAYQRFATLNGSVKTNHFQGINLNLNLSTENFQCLNTTERENDLFFGTVFGTGIVLATGQPENLNLNVKLKTESKTAIYLPLPSGRTAEQNNFITFVNNDPNYINIEETITPEAPSSTNLNLNLELQVTPDAEAQIIIDKKMGDIIKANGSGNLKMEINPAKDIFRMFGNYNIEKGDYLFTLQGVINKKFRIEEGSSIAWNGDPLDANMDIKAVYRVKTSLKQLLMDSSYTTRVPVDCQILLTQKLMSPNIKFNIDVPNVDTETKALVEGALNTEEKVNTQFLGLLVINSFIADPNATGLTTDNSNSNLGATGLYNTASELLSNQLSNWLSQWSNKVDVGVNYRPGMENELSSDQWEVALSTQILNDRVSINGNLDYGNSKNTSNQIAGDFNVDVKLNKSGKLRLKAFTRSNDDILATTQESNYTTGAGILYREEFNNLKDLRKKITHTFKAEEAVPLEMNDDSISQDSLNIRDSLIIVDDFIKIK